MVDGGDQLQTMYSTSIYSHCTCINLLSTPFTSRGVESSAVGGSPDVWGDWLHSIGGEQSKHVNSRLGGTPNWCKPFHSKCQFVNRAAPIRLLMSSH